MAATHFSPEELAGKWPPLQIFYDEVFEDTLHDGVVPEASGLAVTGDHSCYYRESERARLIVDTVLAGRVVTR